MGKLWSLMVCASMVPLIHGCGSSCKPTQATSVASSFGDPCFSVKAGGMGDTCGRSPQVLVSNACSSDWVNTTGILVKAGEVDKPFSTTQAQISGDRYQIVGTIGSKSAVVSFTITEIMK